MKPEATDKAPLPGCSGGRDSGALPRALCRSRGFQPAVHAVLVVILLAFATFPAPAAPTPPGEDRPGPRALLLPYEDCLNCRTWTFSPEPARLGVFDEVATRCRESPDPCELRSLFVDPPYEILGMSTRRPADKSHLASLLVRHLATDETHQVFQLGADSVIARTRMPRSAKSPVGRLVIVPLRFTGTGALDEDYRFLWDGGDLVEFDDTSWLEELDLPPGLEISKGVNINPVTLTARSLLRQDGDGNCCPSGGAVEVELGLEGRKLVVERQTLSLPDSATPEDPGI